MKKYLFILAIMIISLVSNETFARKSSNYYSSVQVNGYTKSNGTYVYSHKRTYGNHTERDNWSSKPNINPYTSKPGSKEPRY